MFFSFFLAAFYAARFTIYTVGLHDSWTLQTLIAALFLLCLPPFFSFTSFLYDPPQIFLFTAGLYYIATSDILPLTILFPFCCINKETAVLLIPLFYVVHRKKISAKPLISMTAYLFVCYIVIKGSIGWLYRNNPGSFVEIQLFRNFNHIAMGWTFSDAITIGIILLSVVFAWREKPQFLKTALVWIGIPLLFLATFLGIFVEWRAFYEIYPVIFALMADSVYRMLYQHAPNITQSDD